MINKIVFNLIANLNRSLRALLLGSFRQQKIANEIVKLISKFKSKKKIKLLDFGSGYFKPSLAELVLGKFKKSHTCPNFICADFYNKSELIKLNKNSEIQYINLKTLPNTKQKFDYCIVSDTLHHVKKGVNDLKYLSKILIDLKKKTKYIIIKDHFEYNYLSRTLLQILDFLGNYQNKTNLPKKYFTPKTFKQLVNLSNLKILYINDKISYYPWYFIFFNSQKLHFITILKKK
ncbi:hypothetical protein OAO75_03110 [Candidatus Pelagibacter ubique]|nr:hypothetical protein [Candidatus Pelagibacter ubique]